jgi:hypothetical protein
MNPVKSPAPLALLDRPPRIAEAFELLQRQRPALPRGEPPDLRLAPMLMGRKALYFSAFRPINTLGRDGGA